jgi:hypothetical protein
LFFSGNCVVESIVLGSKGPLNDRFLRFLPECSFLRVNGLCNEDCIEVIFKDGGHLKSLDLRIESTVVSTNKNFQEILPKCTSLTVEGLCHENCIQVLNMKGTHLISLDLSIHSSVVSAGGNFKQILPKCTSLKVFNICDENCTSVIMQNGTNLRSLEITPFPVNFDTPAVPVLIGAERLHKLSHLKLFLLNRHVHFSLEPLRALRSLSSLQIYYDNYSRASDTGFSPISDLIGLKSVKIQRLKNYSFLQPLSNLEEIDIRGGEISDIDFLSRFKNLKVLNLDRLRLSGNCLSPLSDLSQLKELSIIETTCVNADGTPVENLLQPIASVESLETLYVDPNKVHNGSMSVLSSLPKLTSLYVRVLDMLLFRDILNLNSLSGFSKLEVLEITDLDRIFDITPLNNCVSLKTLYLPSLSNGNNLSPLYQVN